MRVYVPVVGVGGGGTLGRQDGSKHIVCKKLTKKLDHRDLQFGAFDCYLYKDGKLSTILTLISGYPDERVKNYMSKMTSPKMAINYFSTF